MLKYVHHLEYLVHDRDAMVDYLQNTFGMKADRLEVNSRGREAHFNVGNTQIQILEPSDPTSSSGKLLAANGPGVSHVAWAIDNFQEMVQKLSANGNKPSPEKNVSAEGQVHKPTTKSHDYQVINIDLASSHGLKIQLVGVDNSLD